MLLFLDESGSDRGEAPYEVLAGVAIQERDLWNLIQAIQFEERNHFGMTLMEAQVEFKGNRLLKRKVFKFANQATEIAPQERKDLAYSFLRKGQSSADGGPGSSQTRREFTAYGQAAISFVKSVFGLCGQFHTKVFACIVSKDAPRPASRQFLRRDYNFLFERYFYYLEDFGPNESGLVVFDEIEKAMARLLIDQMGVYFLKTTAGKARSSRIVPEPFFVHSDLTSAVQLADLVAYCLNWGFRLKDMSQPLRPEIRQFADQLFHLQYRGQRESRLDGQIWPVYGIIHIDDLRPRDERG